MDNSELKRLERTEAYIAISNVMGKYVFHRMNEELKLVTDLFAPLDNLRIEMPSGTYTGRDAAYRCFEVDHAVDPAAPPTLVMHNICTPVIEVAADCNTAVGVWISPGIATARLPGGAKGLWAWVKYDCDFIRLEGQWKIWHMRKHEVFTIPTDSSWADPDPMASMMPPPAPGEKQAPPKKHLGSNDQPPAVSTKFSLTEKVPAIPAPPEPYISWKDKN